MYNIITFGSITRDVFMRSKDLLTIRSAAFKTGAAECLALGSKVEVSEIHYLIGGSAANTAVTFARQGFKTACVARVGKDLRGEEIKNVLKKEKVDIKFIQDDPGRMSPYSIVLLTPSGERSILVYRGAGEYLSKDKIPWRQMKSKWFYITHLGGKAAALFPILLRFAAKRKIKVAVNPGATQLRMPFTHWRPLLKYIDILVVNREEASYMTHIPYEKEHAIFEKLDRWVKGIVVMTEGPHGVIVSDGKYRWRTGVLQERRLVDRTGAGDAFGSGFVAGIIRKNNIPYALQLGSANATAEIEHIGAQVKLLRKEQSIWQWGKLKITKERAT